MEENKNELSPHIRPLPTHLSERDKLSTYRSSQESGFDSSRDADQGMLRAWTLEDTSRVFFKYRWFIGLVSVLGLFLAAAYAFFATPQFTAEATLKIGTYAPLLNGAGIEDSMRQQTREQDYLNTQVSLLSSLSLADKVYSEPGIQQKLSEYFSRQTGLFGFLKPFRERLFGSGNEKKLDVETLEKSYENPIDKLKSYLNIVSIQSIRKTALVNVSVTTSDPQLSARVANTHAQGFIDLMREDRQQSTLENLLFLKRQSEELADKLAQAERNLASYAEENAIVSVNKDENIVVRKMAELNELLTAATSRRILAETKLKESQSGSGLNTSANDDESIQSLRLALKQAESEYSSLAEKFKPGYPKMVQLKARIDNLNNNIRQQRGQMLGALEADYKSAVASEKALQEQLEMQKSQAFELSRREVQYNIMKRDYESIQDLHQSILRQLKEAQVSSESSGTNVSIADKAAVPSGPSSPRKLRCLLIGLLGGVLLGISLAVTFELFDNTLKTPEDVQRSLRVPSLGVIPVFNNDETSQPLEQSTTGSHPRLDEQELIQTPQTPADVDPSWLVPSIQDTAAISDLVVASAPRSIASESFRAVRTAILLSSADNPPRTIMVTSAKKSEGKTTLVSNLALALAQSSSRVVLIDADLRRPSVHSRFNIDPNNPGLVDFLTGLKPIEEVVHQTELPSLHVISCGPLPPNPAELVGSQKMATLIQDLKEQYDYVLIDTPPVLPVTDAVMLSRNVDGVALVVRGQATHTPLVRDAVNRVRRAGANLLGVVLNDVNIRSGDYQYYYRDTYSYYQDEEERPKRRRAFA